MNHSEWGVRSAGGQRFLGGVARLGAVCGFVVWLGACAAVPAPPPAAAAPASTTATVLRTIDGDTLDVDDDTHGRIRLRVLGIDSPEVHKPGWTVGCWGPESARFAAETLTGQRVTLVTDSTQDRHDRYGRTLSYVEMAGGMDYSVMSARAGMARAYVYEHKPVARYSDIAAAEAEARAAARGLWGPPCEGNTGSRPT